MPGALSTDLYELTMAAGHHAAGDEAFGSFELFVRELPPVRNYLVTAGLEQALSYLENWACTSDDIAYLRTVPALKCVAREFFDDYLPALRFSGDVWALPEGTPVFAGEPMLRVRAPLAEAQLVETALLATILFQTAVASKAARVVDGAAGRPVIEFGSRRAHGTDAALHAARAAHVGGCQATSNVEAGHRFGVPVSGTMAHSWVMAHADERTAFERYAAVHGSGAVLLIDTYDPVEAARTIVRAGLRPAAVRLDSGDLAGLSRVVRGILDGGRLTGTQILVSGDLDEHRVSALVASGAPIDAFGVGTAVSAVVDAPALGGVYKLVEIERAGHSTPVVKLSAGKRTLPGAKQVWRVGGGTPAMRDVLGLATEADPPDGLPLLSRVMRGGRRTALPRPISVLRDACSAARVALPGAVRGLAPAEPYPVEMSAGLSDLTARTGNRAAGTGSCLDTSNGPVR